MTGTSLYSGCGVAVGVAVGVASSALQLGHGDGWHGYKPVSSLKCDLHDGYVPVLWLWGGCGGGCGGGQQCSAAGSW